MYKAPKDTYLENSKASIIFSQEEYSPRNKAEEELLEEWVTAWKVKKIWVKVETKEVKEEKISRKK